jgi:hypothetical protein
MSQPYLPGWRRTRPAAVSERTGLARHKGCCRIAQFSRRFADPFQTPLNRIVGFLVFRERGSIHTGDVSLNRLRVFDDVF